MSLFTNELLSDALKAVREAQKHIRKSPVPLTKGQVNTILKLQRQVVELRDDAIRLMREQEYSLADIAILFNISPSRVSQISRGIKPPKTVRITQPHE